MNNLPTPLDVYFKCVAIGSKKVTLNQIISSPAEFQGWLDKHLGLLFTFKHKQTKEVKFAYGLFTFTSSVRLRTKGTVGFLYVAYTELPRFSGTSMAVDPEGNILYVLADEWFDAYELVTLLPSEAVNKSLKTYFTNWT